VVLHSDAAVSGVGTGMHAIDTIAGYTNGHIESGSWNPLNVGTTTWNPDPVVSLNVPANGTT
jgi:hypothetical protein